MRFLPAVAVLMALLLPAAAQTSDSSKAAKTKKSKTEPQAAATAEQKNVPPPVVKPPEPASTAPDEHRPDAGKEGDKSKEEHFDVSEVAPIVTHHQTTVNGKILKYTATTGRLPIKRADGKIEAEMFFVAYTLDGQEANTRPLTFAFNGGPGSATVWLHMGALGPRRVVLQPDGMMPAPPYRVEDNPYTMLDRSDLVFVDAMGTGFSRAENSELSKKFWGVKGDIQSFSEFIRLYLTRYDRWTSPLFMFGESYGTTRAAGVSGYLAQHGIAFNGITLLSTVLNFQTLEDNKTNDQPYIFLIPTYTMVAGYHHKLPADLAQDMNKAREEAEHWANTDYAQALAKGDALSAQERQTVIDQMARYTGLTKQFIDEANLRVNVPKFTHELLIDQKLRVGRLDGRFTGPDPQGLLDTTFLRSYRAGDPASVHFGVQQLRAH